MPELVVATQNPGKLREVQQLLAALGVRVRALEPEWAAALPEEGDDYEANARAKAQAAAAAAGRIAVADDSGLEVDALGGAPGPFSARYGGATLDARSRNEHLLAAMRGVLDADRGARFVCVAAVADPAGRCAVARGECAGALLAAPRGEAGFGYDPLFWLSERNSTMAELDEASKGSLSHRGQAFRALYREIVRFLELA